MILLSLIEYSCFMAKGCIFLSCSCIFHLVKRCSKVCWIPLTCCIPPNISRIFYFSIEMLLYVPGSKKSLPSSIWDYLYLFHIRVHCYFSIFWFPFSLVWILSWSCEVFRIFLIQFTKFHCHHFHFSWITPRSFSLLSLISLCCVNMWERFTENEYANVSFSYSSVEGFKLNQRTKHRLSISYFRLCFFFTTHSFFSIIIKNIWFSPSMISRYEWYVFWTSCIDRDAIHPNFRWFSFPNVFLISISMEGRD